MLGTKLLTLFLLLAGPLRIGQVTWTPEAVDPEARTARVVLEYTLFTPENEAGAETTALPEGVYVQISFTRDNIFYWKDDFVVKEVSGRLTGVLEDIEPEDVHSGPVLYDAEFTLYDAAGRKLDSNVQQITLTYNHNHDE